MISLRPRLSIRLSIHLSIRLTALFALLTASAASGAGDDFAATLPDGVQAVWDINLAEREATSTRERICLNGLWRWQPAEANSQAVPTSHWGYFKVPGCWPGVTDYMQIDCQTVFSHPGWKGAKLGGVTAAWHEREITIPDDWAQRRVALKIETLNSYAGVYVDGKLAGEIRFPGGEVDLTKACGPQPQGKHVLSLLVVALPLKGVLESYHDTATARLVKGTVQRRGLCGDVYLVGESAGARIDNLKIDTSVRKWQITFDAALAGLAPDAEYRLRARIVGAGAEAKEFTGSTFRARDLKNGRIASTHDWKPAKLWDVHTPQNSYQVSVALLDSQGRPLDVAIEEKVGFREFWIDGRDFYLNGSRIFLSAVPLDNGQIGAALASYEGARESLKRLQSFGINFVYTHNYGCEPGAHLGFAEILRAADDVGMLVSFSQPHFSHYDWKAADADDTNGYARHAESYVRAAQSHPSVVCYSMSHNATGYDEDMNPDLIDGLTDVRDNWAVNNAKLALRAEAIVHRCDPSRIVYHHASGNLGSMFTINFYPNFAPIQELSDWFEHWATAGVKPVFLCEYGAPFTWDWAMYRGWFKGQREFGSAQVPWELCLAEWNSQFLGDRSFRIGEPERANLRWEAKQFRDNKLWHRWDYPFEMGSRVFDDRQEVIGRYTADNWRAFRAWGVSANSPWEHGHFWKLRDGVDKRRRELKVDWNHLQRPGFSADYIDQRFERIDTAFELADWIPAAPALALLRNNRPLLAYIAGKPSSVTDHDHDFYPGETVEKQLLIINNSRETISCDASWSLELTPAVGGQQNVSLPTGQQQRIALKLQLPATLTPGRYEIKARVAFAGSDIQEDTLSIHILPRPIAPAIAAKIAIFDPAGETTALLKRLKIEGRSVDAAADLSSYDVLIVGKSALTTTGPAPNIDRVAAGLKVIVFEQSAAALEQRLGMRVVEYGLRQVFPRVADHPALAGVDVQQLADWRGAATLTTPRLKYELRPQHGPTVKWCDIPVSRVWRCGNRGNVASVLIEKPAAGDFLPIVDGGYSLQYSPLMEYRQGRGMMLFCQLDVTGRTETGAATSDPAAETLTRNLIAYAANWKPAPQRQVFYAGEPAGKRHLESIGVTVGAYEGSALSADQLLVVGPSGGKALAPRADAIAAWLKSGGRMLAIGLDQADVDALPALNVRMQTAEHIAACFEPFGAASPLAGIGPADVHDRDPKQMPLVSSGATIVGDGVLAYGSFANGLPANGAPANVVFCQLAPWQFADTKQANMRQTHRRATFLLSRILAGLGGAGSTPILTRFSSPVATASEERRWSAGLYADQPEEWDDPYRFFRW